MSELVFNKLKSEIEKNHPNWKFNKRSNGNWSLSNNKVFAYFDFSKNRDVVIRARIYPTNNAIKEFSSWRISDRVDKIGTWRDEVIDIPVSDVSKINEYISLLEITAYGKKITDTVKISISIPEINALKTVNISNTISKFKSIFENTSKKINQNILPVYNPANEVIENKIEIPYYDKEYNTDNNKQSLLNESKITSEEIKNFIYPFAYSYYFATEGTSVPFNKLNSYFKLFEVISTFNAIVLLSALPQFYIREYEQEIWTKDKNRYSRLSMGLWIDLYRRLSNIYKEIIRKDKTFLENLPFGPDFYFSITDKKLLAILEQIPEKRNLFAHSGTSVQEGILKKQLEELDPLLEQLFNKLSFYKPISLIYPLSMKKKLGNYETTIKLLNGAISDPFREKIINVEKDLDSEALYLYMDENQERLKLLPEFIHLHDCFECGQSSLYVFDKMERKKAEYYSFHNINHRYKTDINGLLNIFS